VQAARVPDGGGGIDLLLKLPTVDDWYKLSLNFPKYHKASHTLLKDYGYMQIMDYLDGSGAWSILEFGHGFNSALFEHYSARRDMWGVDDFQGLGYFPASDRAAWEQRFNREIRDKAPECTYRRGLLGRGSTADLPEGYFDVVCSVSVLEELPLDVLQDVLNHVSRLLKPGGTMVGTHDLLLETENPARLGEYAAALTQAGLDFGANSPPMLIGKRTLLESPSAAMLWYQGHQGQDRGFWGHWSTIWTVAAKGESGAPATVPDCRVTWRN
jgi:SAM-dependent methyltransferase